MSELGDAPKTLRSLTGERFPLNASSSRAEASPSSSGQDNAPREAVIRPLPESDSPAINPAAQQPRPKATDASDPSRGLETKKSAPLTLTPGRPARSFPQLPQRAPRRSRGVLWSFVYLVVLPTMFAAYYFAVIASNQYVAEFRFAVKNVSVTTTTGSVSAGSATSSPSNLLGLLGGGASPNSIDNYIVTDYLVSGQAVKDLQERIKLIDLYSRPSIDWWARFNGSRPVEWFLSYWRWTATAQYDPVTGIASVQVRAFSPEDAKLVADTMLKLSEELINRIAVRMQQDTVRFAQNEVRRGEDRVKAVRAKLTELRNKTGVIDPSGSLVASNSQLVQTLRANLAQLETQLVAMKAERLDATAPAVRRVNAQIKATNDQIAAVERNVSQKLKGSSLSDTVAQYEQLDQERQFAQTMLTGAQQTLDQARAVAAAQLLYVEPYVRPSLPESALYPRRLASVVLTAFFAFVVWTIVLLGARSMREHYI